MRESNGNLQRATVAPAPQQVRNFFEILTLINLPKGELCLQPLYVHTSLYAQQPHVFSRNTALVIGF